MKVLVVDDEENVRKGIMTFLALSGHDAVGAKDLSAARSALAGAESKGEGSRFGVAIVDVYVGEENGSDLLDFVSASRTRTPIVMISGKGSVKDAVAALQKGAYDFLEKPLDTDRLLAILRNLDRETSALRALDAIRESWLAEHVFLGESPELAAAFEAARRAAASPLSILVNGPTGSGKELVARWIHLCSPRSQGPFVAVNCAAVPLELGESAFFGSRRGAFTGANSDKAGYFEAASGGTLFLDEVGEIDLGLQASLLRAVETGEIQPVGAQKADRADVRIVAATNRDLRAAIAGGRFREDLYWRLAQVRVTLPSLAQRREDIDGLADFLAAPIRARMGREAPTLTADARSYLRSRAWQGNVRELRAFLERALWLAPPGGSVDAEYLAALEGDMDRAPVEARSPADGARSMGLAEAKLAFERAYVLKALEESGGSVARAAERLGLRANNLSRKLRELGLR